MEPNSHQAFAANVQKQRRRQRVKLENWLIVAILTGVSIFTAGDLISDVGEGASTSHLIAEAIVALLSLAGAASLWRRNLQLRDEVITQKERIALISSEKRAALVEAEKWRAEASQALRGLSDAIDVQMSRWELTKSEKEVALLLLKGLSLKEIGEVRGVSEKTARAQSFAIYSKSGLSGRAELSAFFLEDLMLPQISD